MEYYYNLMISGLKKIIELLVLLLIVGVVVGLVFPDTDPFGVINRIGKVTTQLTPNGVGTVLAVLLIVLMYKRK
jgi:hypothetical protein